MECFPWKRDEETLWCNWHTLYGCRCTVDPRAPTSEIAENVHQVLTALVEALEAICHGVPFVVEQLQELRRRSLDLISSGEQPAFPILWRWADEFRYDVIQCAYANLHEGHRVTGALRDLQAETAPDDEPKTEVVGPEPPAGHLVYLFGAPGVLKIGFTTNVAGRFSNLRASVPMELSVLGLLRASRDVERDLHKRFAAHRLRGEWYRDINEIREFFASDYRRVEPEPDAFRSI